MKKHTYAFICILGSTTTFLTHSANALVSDFAAAGANVNTYLFEDGVDNHWDVGNDGTYQANAGSSADILGFYDAAGNAIPEENYSLVSGMQVVPEASSFGLLAGLSALVLVATRRQL